jgi:hypothetical protein
MPNAIWNIRDKPLYSEAVYGMRKMKIIIAATKRIFCELYLVPKKSGIVELWSPCVILRVRLPRIIHGSKLPRTALPSPIHAAEIPNFQPNCPAYPTNMTAEKYEVPKEKAVSQAPTFLPPSTNEPTLEACFRPIKPTASVTAAKMANIVILINILKPLLEI